MNMKEKINIAELLKDCPSGMELNCILYDNIYFDTVGHNAIKCYIQNKGYRTSITFDIYGGLIDSIPTKCIIFPKGKTTWEGFVPPCKFKVGDIIYTNASVLKKGSGHTWISIFKEDSDKGVVTYAGIKENGGNFHRKGLLCLCSEIVERRLATEQEKQKLFHAIKSNGYRWNAETKTLEELIEPKFKVGDKIRHRLTGDVYKILFVLSNGCGGGVYDVAITNEIGKSIDVKEQDDYELVPNKFDITTLKPYEEEIMEERKYTDLRLDVDQDDKLATEATIDGNKIIPPENYLIGKITRVDNGMLVEFVKKQPVYPKTYNECCDVIGCDSKMVLGTMPVRYNILVKLEKLLICRNAYWKIAGEQKGLGKPWESAIQDVIWGIIRSKDEVEKYSCHYGKTNPLEFPTEEMRDAFYENFKELIEQCKELL